MGIVVGKKVADFDHCILPGDFYITAPNQHEGGARRISFRCPCGCGDLCNIRVRDDGQNIDGAWGWDKNYDRPTCTPSIAVNGNHWHGYLKDGIFESC